MHRLHFRTIPRRETSPTNPLQGKKARARGLLRPLPLLLILVGGARWASPLAEASAQDPDLSRALAAALGERSLRAEPYEIYWLDRPGGFLGTLQDRPRAILLAHEESEPADVYLARVRLSPEGRLIGLEGVYNLTDTSAVEEQALTVAGERAAWTLVGQDSVVSFHMADLHQDMLTDADDWGQVKRLQNSITNLQATGQWTGVGRRSFDLDPAATRVSLGFTGQALLVNADGHEIRIPTDGGPVTEGQRFVKEQVHHAARPGNLITWAVDRARALPWFGNDRMQIVKTIAFEGLDRIESMMGTVTGDDGSEQAAAELEGLSPSETVTFTDPETRWPPPPMKPLMKPIEREGQWIALADDPFIRRNPGAPPAFVTSFIRTDRERMYSQIFVTLWDPRQVELHTMSGTVEPKSATGETGPGLVPRKPEVMGRLVGALNGGFQATHGEFGMMADDVVYLPPKPYAATIVEMRDGATGFGTWPKGDAVPENMVGFRQNMTALVSDGVINPYKRNWWGGVPPGWKDESRTVRSALCLTKEGFIAYLYGTSTDADHLALAAVAARCDYAVHLDMNAGHTGLEFYQAGPVSELPLLGRPLDSRWEAEGAVTDMPGWRFRGRRMIRFMGLMNFPRYIGREARDFFYLTLRHVVPGEDLAPLGSAATSAAGQAPAAPAGAGAPASDEGKWTVKGLPHHGWPYALATTWLGIGGQHPDARIQVLQLDPRTVRVAAADEKDPPVVLAVPERPAQATATFSLWLDGQAFTLGDQPPNGTATRLLSGVPEAHPSAREAAAAVGVGRGGFLFYAELGAHAEPGPDSQSLQSTLRKLGCQQILYLARPAGLALGGALDLTGRPTPVGKTNIELVRRNSPGAQRVFTDTPLVAPEVWYPLQAKRIRYFKKPKRKEDAASAPAGGTAQANPSSPANTAPQTSTPSAPPPTSR